MIRLIFETTTQWDGTPIVPVHRKVVRAKSVRLVAVEGDHRTSSALVAGNNRVLATQWEPGAEWIVGDYLYEHVRIESA